MRAIQVLIAVAIAACGGEAYDLTPAPESNERPLYVENGQVVRGEGTIEVETAGPIGDIGQSRQPLIFPKNGAGNPGIKPDTYQSCYQGEPNQNCVVTRRPGRLVWFLYEGTAAQKTEIRAHVNQWITDMINMGLDQCSAHRCWKFREATSLDDPDLDLVISLSQSVNGSCPGAADQTRGLICWGGSTTGVDKDATTGLYGTYHRFADHIVPVATVDYTQIQATSGLTAAQKFNRTRQAVRAILLGYASKGLAIIGNNRCNNTFLIDPNVACVESASEVCWLENSGDFGDPDYLRRLGPQCGN